MTRLDHPAMLGTPGSYRTGIGRRPRSRSAALVTATALAAFVAVPTGGASASTARSSLNSPSGTVPQALAATTGGTLRAWGGNSHGALGDGSSTKRTSPVTVKLPRGTRVTAVRSACGHSLAVTTAGAVLAWGDNGDGQLGTGGTGTHHKPVKIKLPKGTKVRTIRAGCAFSIALTTSGHVLAWGYNGHGELGDATTRTRFRPVRVKLPSGTKVTAIAAGDNHSLALTRTGHVLAWGDNMEGQLGDGTTANRKRPVRVKLPAGTRVKSLAAGTEHSLALSASALFAWGENFNGELGDGTTTNRDKPEQINFLFRGPPVGKITSLVAGCFHSMALTSKGFILAWGANGDGQLGDGTTTERHTGVFVHLPSGTKVKSISAGCADSLALTTKGRVLAWGDNLQGELGNGTTMASEIPVRVHLASGLRATAIGAGADSEQGFAIVTRPRP